MLSVTEARQRILSHFSPLASESIPLGGASGRTLAVAITSGDDHPTFDNSSVDGFALSSADTVPGGGATLSVVADIQAGRAPGLTLFPGQAARIMTGAPLPAGADAAIMVEETDYDFRDRQAPLPARVAIRRPVAPGENIRRRGSDIRAGQTLLASGHLLRVQDLGLLAMLGMAEVCVHRMPRLALFSNGDELVPPNGRTLPPGKARDINSLTLENLARLAGAQVSALGIAPDTLPGVEAFLERAASLEPDFILASAGVSVGAFDHVRQALETSGELDFWRVDMRPGKPLAFGQYRGIPFFGLPGNPVSAFIGFEVFVRPALECLSGRDAKARTRLRVRLTENVESDGRESYLRAVVTEVDGVLTARLTGNQGSGNILSLAQANALLIVPSGVKSLPASAEADVWMLES